MSCDYSNASYKNGCTVLEATLWTLVHCYDLFFFPINICITTLQTWGEELFFKKNSIYTLDYVSNALLD